MIIPEPLVERQSFYDQIVRECSISRIDRFNLYQILRNYYLFGSVDYKGAPYNKIYSTIDSLTSIIYSPDSMRFTLQLGTEASPDDVHKSVPLAREITEQWRVSKTHMLFGLGLRWALVFGCMLIKTQWSKHRVRSYLVEPHQFGVLREDVTDLSDQEAFTHHYSITRSQLESSLSGNPRKNSILARISNAGLPEGSMSFSGGLSRLLVGGSVGGVPGSVALPGGATSVSGGMTGGPSYDYLPKIEAELIDMCDLYVWNDREEEYQVITRAAPDVTIYDRPASQLGHVKGLPPFNVIRGELDLYDYFWGGGFIARLTWLQDWRTERVLDIRRLLGKQVDPPQSVTGGVGIAEEKLAALRARAGLVSFPTPNAKVNVHAPEVPNDVFTEIQQIDAMFDDMAGLGHILQGKGDAGVRSRGQADLMARLGSSRPKQKAMLAEDSAQEVAGLTLRSVQDHSEQRFTTDLNGKPLTFTAEQFTRDYEVKVDAHSSSPIFIEDRKHDAITLLEAKAIDRETLLEMFDPPNLQDLKERLKKIELSEAQARQQELQMQAAQGQSRPTKKGKPE